MKKTKGTVAPWNKGRKLPPEPLTDDEVRDLLAACGPSSTGIRNRALLAVVYRSGLRCSEALALKPKDLDRKKGTIRVLMGKGRRSRLVGLDAGAWDILALWLERRDTVGLTSQNRVFCTLKGRPMQTAYIRAMVARIGKRAGIEKRVHLHGLRHSHAAELRGEGVDIGIISKQLGHSSIATTATYLDHIAPEAVVETIKAREWSV